MKKIMNGQLALGSALLAGALCLSPVGAGAQVAGQCADCHTMHNSQDGDPMSTDVAGAADSNVYRALTKGDCVGCHTSSTNTTVGGATNNIPYVNQAAEPAATLAGGSFYWVRNAADNPDRKGHNVEGITDAADATLVNTPPGFNVALNATYTDASRLTCAGTNGCHGGGAAADSYADMSGAHHGKNNSGGVNGYVDGSDLASSYRFLSGIKGLEDDDWENTSGAVDHNVYYGVDRATDAADSTATISALCAKCHGNFHSSATAHADDATMGISYGNDMSSPWVRHPTDFDMWNVRAKADYAGYGGVGNPYVVESPVASANVSDASTRVANVYTAQGDAIVTCISCHRAHGSANDDLLRWDYADMDAHAGGSGGCFNCHTTKDDV
ncbi:cytochrome c3 family protein [Thiovibrio sp. JS02]